MYGVIVTIVYCTCRCLHCYIVPPPARIRPEFNDRYTFHTSLDGCELGEGRCDEELEVAAVGMGAGCLLQTHHPVAPCLFQRCPARPQSPQVPHVSCTRAVDHQTEFLGDRLSSD